MKRFSDISIRGVDAKKRVVISSSDKPKIEDEIISKWQLLLNTVGQIIKVPSALIMQLNENNIEVFLKSNTAGNPYERGEQAKLVYGLYCETVIGTQKSLLIPDARISSLWKDNNPDVDINMVSYLGFPLNWPDGESFGTVCVLDNKRNEYNEIFRNFLFQVKEGIETDLKLLVSNKVLRNKNKELEKLNHTKTRFLSLISHDVRGNISTAEEFLALLVNNIDSIDKDYLLKALKSLKQNVSSSFQMLENLLYWSKSDLVDLNPSFEVVDVIELLNRLEKYFSQAIQIKNIDFKKKYSSGSILLRVDENMIKVGLRNVISNAIKYTHPGGSIFVKVKAHEDFVTVDVEDTGIGISKEMQKKIFNYSDSYNKKGTDGESSSGIGLLLAKEFFDKNNATLIVESEVGKGTLFRICFPA